MQVDPWSIPPPRDEYGKPQGLFDRLNPLLSFGILILIFVIATLISYPIIVSVMATSATAEDFTSTLLSPIGTLVLLLLQDIILVLVPFYVWVKPGYITFDEMGLDSKNLPVRILLGGLVGVGLGGLVLGAQILIGYDSSGGVPAPLSWSALDYAVMVISVSVVAPITEEFYFRGIMFRGALKYFDGKQNPYGFLTALLYSSFLFSIIHGYDLFGAVAVFMGGMVFALLYHKTDSIITAIIAHAAYNFIIVTAAYIGFI
jgi:membrane protease YdiL (CAAX protease family)